MAFKKAESGTSGSTPFFSEWCKELPEATRQFLDDKLMSPKYIKAVQSGKGYMLNFDDTFSLFLWKGSSIGQIIKKANSLEEGNLLLLRFTNSGKKFDYEIGFDDEVEVTITEDKYEEGLFLYEQSTDYTPPIAPDDFRKYIIQLPIVDPSIPVKLTPTPKAINKHK